MKETIISENELDVHPKVNALVNRVKQKVALAMEKVGANQQDAKKYPLSPDGGSLEQVIMAYFRTLPAEKRKKAIAKIMDRVNAPKKIRENWYPDFAEVDLKKSTSIEKQSWERPFPDELKFSVEELNDFAKVSGNGKDHTAAILGNGMKSIGLPIPKATDKLEFRIHSVECEDRTGDGPLGTEATDEIRLGGACIDQTGTTTKVSDFSVQTFSKDGQKKTYSPPRRFTFVDLNKGTEYPKTVFIIPVLAEADKTNSFSQFLYNLTKSVEEEITAALVAAVSIGLAIGSSGGPVGALIGAAIGAVVGYALDFFKKIIDDEIWDAPTVSCTIPSLNARWSGNTYSPEHLVTYNGFGGKYTMRYSWNLVS